MRIGDLKGIYLQYQGTAQPVETYDRKVYPFQAKFDRTCLIADLKHVTYLLSTGREYQIVGVEVDKLPTSLSDNTIHGAIAGATAEEPKPKAKAKAKRGRKQ